MESDGFDNKESVRWWTSTCRQSGTRNVILAAGIPKDNGYENKESVKLWASSYEQSGTSKVMLTADITKRK